MLFQNFLKIKINNKTVSKNKESEEKRAMSNFLEKEKAAEALRQIRCEINDLCVQGSLYSDYISFIMINDNSISKENIISFEVYRTIEQSYANTAAAISETSCGNPEFIRGQMSALKALMCVFAHLNPVFLQKKDELLKILNE